MFRYTYRKDLREETGQSVNIHTHGSYVAMDNLNLLAMEILQPTRNALALHPKDRGQRPDKLEKRTDAHHMEAVKGAMGLHEMEEISVFLVLRHQTG